MQLCPTETCDLRRTPEPSPAVVRIRLGRRRLPCPLVKLWLIPPHLPRRHQWNFASMIMHCVATFTALSSISSARWWVANYVAASRIRRRSRHWPCNAVGWPALLYTDRDHRGDD